MIRQDLAVPDASDSPELDKISVTLTINFCTANLTFMIKYGVRCVHM